MARLASESKAGFYATPVNEMNKVVRILTVKDPATSIHIYDPCCGEGVALQSIHHRLEQLGATVTSYGVELEEDRAMEAAKVLSKVHHTAYQYARMEPFSINLLWLNPPYQTEEDGKRTETKFLRTLTDLRKGVLMKGGILLYCVPQYVIEDSASILAARFRNIHVYRFSDGEYEVFKQVVLVGEYGKNSPKEIKREYHRLVGIAKADPNTIPTLDEIGEIIIPQHEEEFTPYFRSDPRDINELKKDLGSSQAFTDTLKAVIPMTSSVKMKRPLLPLKPAHMGIALAAGAVGGNLGTHIISGVTRQKIDKENVYNDEGERVGERKTIHFTSIIRAFSNEYGVVDLE